MTREPVRQSCGYCLTARTPEGHRRCPRRRDADQHGVAWECACTHESHQEGK